MIRLRWSWLIKREDFTPFSESSRTADGTEERKDYLFFRLKTLEGDLGEAFNLAADMFLKSEISDPARVRDLLFEMRNDFKSSIIPAGHSYCAVRAAAEFDRVLEREDEWRGSRQMIFLNDLTLKSDESVPGICSALEELRSRLFVRERMVFNITSAGDYFRSIEQELSGFINRIPQGEPAGEAAGIDLKKSPSFHLGALAVPSSVFFTARTLPAAFLGTEKHAHQSLLAHMMKTNDLWEEVRMKNGTYGVYASVNGTEGLMTVSTYRDPESVRQS